MVSQFWMQLLFFVSLLTILSPFVGRWLEGAFFKDPPRWMRALRFFEKALYRLSGIDEKAEMTWKSYAVALLVFNLLGLVFLFLLQLGQGFLPLHENQLGGVPWHLALNTAVSFVTNTNWQSYAGETTLSDFTQMVGLTTQNFLSAATGLGVFLVFVRAISRKQTAFVGNFWVDLVRSCVYVLIPLSVVAALIFVQQGVVQSVAGALQVSGLEDGFHQIIARGPVASQEAIKLIGTNGGGFFNANSAHPFENPTPLTNFLQMLLIFLIPAALPFLYGRRVGSLKHGWALYSAMLALFCVMAVGSFYSEISANPVMGVSPLLEGKELRFGTTGSILYSVVTTAASCGAVNAMHSSLSPLSGGIAMLNMMVGEVIFGGVGAGMYGLLIFVILTVFLAGLMVGRTPEYLGKKIEAWDLQMVTVAVLTPSAMILSLTALSVAIPAGLSSLSGGGPHGFSEILYAFTSAAANNGSAFAGLNANTPYYNLTLALAMFVGRFGVILPFLALAGNLASKKSSPPSSGTFPTEGPLFVLLLIAVILIVGALTFFPALTLGPIVEHLLMKQGLAQ